MRNGWRMDVKRMGTCVRLRGWVCMCVFKIMLSLFYFILFYFIRLIYNKKFSKMVRRSKRCVGSRRTRRHSRRSTRSRRVRRVQSRHTRGRRIHDVKIGGVFATGSPVVEAMKGNPFWPTGKQKPPPGNPTYKDPNVDAFGDRIYPNP
jgi:hypothetical protein